MNLRKARNNFKAFGKILRGIVCHEYAAPNIEGLSDLPADELKRVAEFQPPIAYSLIEEVLKHYKINATFSDMRIGSTVTTYEFDLAMGTRAEKIERYQKDIARDLGIASVRILPLIEGTSKMGVEVPHDDKFMVSYKELIKKMPKDLELPLIMGEDTYGNFVYEDLTDMPHLLIAGRTGSGKSVFINNAITTLIATKTPSELKLMLVDPKQVEFTAYEGAPHLMGEIANDADEARALLDTLVNEMDARFELLNNAKVKKIADYNKTAKVKLPYIVLVVDEFAELMMMGAPKDKEVVEKKIVRLAQKARACGIHMILATQKPLVAVMTSLIKANMPARIAFNVASAMDSKVILDETGAENLTGNGDMLFRSPIAKSLKRVQAPYINDTDIEYIVTQIR